jgi:hypothetical protein
MKAALSKNCGCTKGIMSCSTAAILSPLSAFSRRSTAKSNRDQFSPASSSTSPAAASANALRPRAWSIDAAALPTAPLTSPRTASSILRPAALTPLRRFLRAERCAALASGNTGGATCEKCPSNLSKAQKPRFGPRIAGSSRIRLRSMRVVPS